jgi:MFS family permease
MRNARPRLVDAPFTIVTAGSLAYFTAYAMLIPTLPRYVEDVLHGGDVAVGVAVGSFAFTALIFRPLAGVIGDRHGRRALIIIGSGFVALSNLGIAATSSLAMLVVMRLASGVGEAFVFVGAITIINDLAPAERRGEAVSLFSVSLYAGIALGPLLGESIFNAFSYDAVWLVAAALCMLDLVAGAAAPETRPNVEPAEHRTGLARVLHPAGIFPGIVMFTSVVGFAGYSTFLPLYVDELGLDGSRVVLLVYGLILVAIRLFGARIPDVVGVSRAGLVGQSFSVVGLITMGVVQTVPGLFTGTAIFAVGQALTFPAFMALAVGNAPPAERGTAAGTTTAFVDLGFGLGPVILGGIVALTDEPTAFLAAAAFGVAGIFVQIAGVRARSR